MEAGDDHAPPSARSNLSSTSIARAPVPDISKLNLNPTPTTQLPSSSSTEEALPPHRSHDPQSNLKRSDPFQFGSRYLLENDDVFEFNAWDHVETDEDYKQYAESQYAKQREKPVSEFDKSMFDTQSFFIGFSGWSVMSCFRMERETTQDVEYLAPC